MGVRQRPTRAATAWSSTTTASSSPPSSSFDIQPSSSPTTTTTTQQQQQQHQEHSPLSTINLENDYNTANQQHKKQNQPPPRGSSSSKSDYLETGHVAVNMTTTTSTGTNTTMTFPSRKQHAPPRVVSKRTISSSSSSMKAPSSSPRQQKRSLRHYFPSTSLLALFIMMASGCFFFNIMMVLLPHHLASSVSDTAIEMQQRRSVFSLLPSSYHASLSSSNRSHLHQLRQNNNNNNGPVDYYHARVVYSKYNLDNENIMDGEWSVTPPPPHASTTRRTVVAGDEFMRVTESIQPIPSNDATNDGNEECIPMADWQTASYPNCNAFHEIDLPTSIDAGAIHNDTSINTAVTTRRRSSSSLSEDVFRALAEGWFRTTWQWNRRHVASTIASNETTSMQRQEREEESVVVKTLRIEREFLWEYYDLHNRDAVAMERLTFSPYVVNVYGYCGQSAINELADFPVPEMTYLEKMNRRLRGYNDHKTSMLKLHVAARIATGLAHVHAAGQSSSSSSSSATTPRPAMVHYDLNPKNVALFRGGRPKIVREIYIVI